MPYTVTWDPGSKAEFQQWRQSDAADTATLACVVRLMTALVDGIAYDGPDPSANPHPARRARDGANVAVYCLVEDRDVVRCFGLCGDELRLLVIGPFNSGTVLTWRWSVPSDGDPYDRRERDVAGTDRRPATETGPR